MLYCILANGRRHYYRAESRHVKKGGCFTVEDRDVHPRPRLRLDGSSLRARTLPADDR
ncbi:hypothetical protein MASSI9I_51381 [Massilia sp. 9I]|nr:hypothetical protein MASSI9I_51381 [Massilia sp. 9I]